MPGRRFAVFCVLCGPLFAAGAAPANPDPLPGESPFGPPVEAPAAAGKAAKGEGYELVGMVATPKGPLLSIVRKHDQHSFWIPLGATREGITIVSYDARHDRAVIHADGRKLTLTMRKAAIVEAENPAAEPAAPPEETAPAADASDTPATVEPPPPEPEAPATPAEAENAGPATPAPPGTQAEQETEARMLVSDLLEIGQQQREAYEAAEKKAAEEKPDSPATAPEDAGKPANPPAPKPAGKDASPSSDHTDSSARAAHSRGG